MSTIEHNSRMVDYVITSEPSSIDIDAAHTFLRTSYWSPGVPREVVARAISNSLCFAALWQDKQVGFARVITDKATFAYLADVYVLEEHRGKGLSKQLIRALRSHPDLQGLRRILLATRDAHGLYAQFGFMPLAAPDRFMEVLVRNPYQGDQDTSR